MFHLLWSLWVTKCAKIFTTWFFCEYISFDMIKHKRLCSFNIPYIDTAEMGRKVFRFDVLEFVNTFKGVWICTQIHFGMLNSSWICLRYALKWFEFSNTFQILFKYFCYFFIIFNASKDGIFQMCSLFNSNLRLDKINYLSISHICLNHCPPGFYFGTLQIKYKNGAHMLSHIQFQVGEHDGENLHQLFKLNSRKLGKYISTIFNKRQEKLNKQDWSCFVIASYNTINR